MTFIKQFLATLLTPLRLVFTQPQMLIATPKKLLGMSLPARAAILVFLFLALAVAGVYLGRYYGQQGVPYPAEWLYSLPLIVLLVIVIPVVVYQALRYWLEGDASEFPDIDRAWQAGLAELERNGVDPTALPMFLVLGSASEQQEQALFAATRLRFRIQHCPKGAMALRWYVHDEGIWVVASEVGQTTALATLGERASQGVAQEAPEERPLAAAHGQTVAVDTIDPRQTMAAGSLESRTEPASMIRGTLEISQTMESGVTQTVTSFRAQTAPVQLSEEAAKRQSRRLAHLVRLIRRVREPWCPLNGLLVLLSYRVIQRGDKESVELKHAVAADLETLRRELGLRLPLIALVCGMESEPGFHELVKRLGSEKARDNRFGSKFRPWDPATDENLEALCYHACRPFQDFIYRLFRERDALSADHAVGNRRLFSLLCKIRRLQPRLKGILMDSFGYDSSRDEPHDWLLMGGVYFAATGERADQQAFVKAVFERLAELQESLEWTPQALRGDRRYQTLGNLCYAVAGLLGLAAVALLLLRD
jgi:hypothetical protein